MPSPTACSAAASRRALGGRHTIQSLVLPAGVTADDVAVSRLREAAAGADAFIAVGSGTINDLTKYASALDGKPYAVFATAPSMNGYTSLTASITVHGHKMTLPAQAPAGAFFDLGVLAAAPKRHDPRRARRQHLPHHGAGRLAAVATCCSAPPYRRAAVRLCCADDETATAGPGRRPRSAASLEAMRGWCARWCSRASAPRSSAPASRPARASTWSATTSTCSAPPSRPPVFHGEQVGVTTLSMARLQRARCSTPPRCCGPTPTTEADVRAALRRGTRRLVLGRSSQGKRLDARQGRRAERTRSRATGTAIRERIDAMLLPPTRIEAVLAAAGRAADAAKRSISIAPFYESALLHGREIRNRYTFLDLCRASGRLEPTVATTLTWSPTWTSSSC